MIDLNMCLCARTSRRRDPVEFETRKKRWESILEPVGVTFQELRTYYQFFVGNRGCAYGKRRFEDEWFRVINRTTRDAIPLTYDKVCEHLIEKYWIGVVNHSVTGRIAIDLDTHTDSILTIQERVARIREALPFVIPLRSSASMGIHLYIVAYESHAVNYWKERISATLSRIGLHQRGPGGRDYEILPTEKQILRLPFGKDSYLLDDNLEPIKISKSESIRRVQDLALSHRLAIFNYMSGHTYFSPDLPIKMPPERSTKKIEHERKQSKYKAGPYLEQFMKEDLDTALQTRISSPGIRHNKTLAYAIRLRANGVDKFKAHIRLWNWLDLRRHKSTTIKERPGEATADMARILDWVYSLPESRFHLRVERLTVGDIRSILELVRPMSGKLGRNEVKKMQFLFSVLAFYKYKGKAELPLSQNLLVKMKGISKRTYLPCLEWCTNKNILELVRDANRHLHQARVYRLHYSFADGEPIKTLEDGLHMLLKDSEIRAIFSRRYITSLMQGISIDVQTVP